MTNKERAIDFVSRWLRDSSGFHVGLSDGNTEPDYNDLVDRVAALLDARLQDGEPKRDLIDREEAIRELEILKALHLQNAAISDGQSKYAYECYAAATDHCIHNIRALPSVTETKWQPIETAPRTGRTLLLGYPNRLGKWRTVRGQWFTNEEIGEWENGDDFRAGWYETSEENDEPPNCWLISPTHWMPLPAPPIIQAGASPKERNSTTVPDHGLAHVQRTREFIGIGAIGPKAEYIHGSRSSAESRR
jgi:hypothetical protein